MLNLRASAARLKETNKFGTNSRFVKPVRQHLQARKAKLGTAIPLIPKCPSPTCECAGMPPDLDIDRKKDLYGTMAAYNAQILVSTGQADWKSRIEDEKDTAPWGSVVANIKKLLGPKGRFHDPYRNVLVSASSFAPPKESSKSSQQALLFPSFYVVDGIEPSVAGASHFLDTFTAAKPVSEPGKGERQDHRTLAAQSRASWEGGAIRPISAPTILVCSHNSRDSRCGVLGPLLHAEFVQYINKRHTLRTEVVAEEMEHEDADRKDKRSFASHPDFQPDALVGGDKNDLPINVGMISHIGGHKWAGNVIVYIPPDYHILAFGRQSRGGEQKDNVSFDNVKATTHKDESLLSEKAQQLTLSPLAGKGIWYGRVEPKHVEGIVEQTIAHGNVIRELFRGGIDRNGRMIRI